MLKASSMYLVIVVAVIVAILTSSLISVAFFYRQEYLKNDRYNRLSDNLQSGINILLSDKFLSDDSTKILSLFENMSDSVSLEKEPWGLFDLAISKSFESGDTLQKAFLIAKDAGKDRIALYLNDENRPLSVGGDTRITGDAMLPKSGIKAVRIDGKTYSGTQPVYGHVKISQRDLPKPDSIMLARLEKLFDPDKSTNAVKLNSPLNQSFFSETLTIDLSGQVSDLSNVSLQGKIIIISDTLIKISSNTYLKDVIVFAPAIVIEEGFRGVCQLFARDSIVAGKRVILNYPSVFGVIKPDSSQLQVKIQLGDDSKFSGTLFTYEKVKSERRTIISLGKNSHVSGEIYAAGYLKMDKPLRIDGKVSCNRVVIKTPNSLYENYLIDIILNHPARSKYYLSTELLADKGKSNRILKWMN